MATRPIITLITDFGLEDEYVGALKGVLLSLQPDCQIVDITHAIPPQDILRASHIVSRVCNFFSESTVHLAIVDPGVGTTRPLLAIKTARHFFVGPDNGIFSTLLLPESTLQIHHIVNTNLFLSPVSSTFQGRDIMAPVAARLAGGLDIKEVGPAVSIEACCILPFSKATILDQKLYGEVVSMDHFGNLRTNISKEDILSFAGVRGITLGIGTARIPGVCSTYSDAMPGDRIGVIDSYGFLEISVVGGNAWKQINCGVGAKIEITLRENDLV